MASRQQTLQQREANGPSSSSFYSEIASPPKRRPTTDTHLFAGQQHPQAAVYAKKEYRVSNSMHDKLRSSRASAAAAKNSGRHLPLDRQPPVQRRLPVTEFDTRNSPLTEDMNQIHVSTFSFKKNA